jgi:long-subunit fatty acid transport protein
MGVIGGGIGIALGLVLAGAVPSARAQLPPVEISLPPTLLLPNYDRVPIGQREGLEAGAFVARTNDASASWYNPAGLVRSEKSAINASAVAYEWTTLAVEGLGEKTSRSRFGSISTLVAGVIGAPLIGGDRWRLGFAATTPESWSPGTIDDAFQPGAGSRDEQFTYTSRVAFSSFVPALAAGFAVRPALRVGTSVEVARTSLDQDMDVSGRTLDPDTTLTQLRAFRSTGTALEARLNFGAQWDFASRWTLGALVATPGARLRGQTLVDYLASAGGTPGYGDLYFRDEEARFEYRHPWRVAVGIARELRRGSIEVDVRYHGSTDTYALFSSSAQGRQVVSTPGNPPVATPVVFRDVTYKAREVWNFAAGGRYALSSKWTAHAGFFTDTSPVADPQATILRRANLVGFTGGATLSGQHLSGSLGFGYSSGDSGQVPTGRLADGTVVQSSLSIRSLSFTYAVSYVF